MSRNKPNSRKKHDDPAMPNTVSYCDRPLRPGVNDGLPARCRRISMKQGIDHWNQHQRDQGGTGETAHHRPGQGQQAENGGQDRTHPF